MEFTTKQIAHLVGGKLYGKESEKINKVSKIQEADKGSISFLSNPKYENFIYNTDASAILVSKSFSPRKEVKASLIFVEDPYTSFTSLLEEYHRLNSFAKVGTEEPAYTDESAKFGEKVYRGAFSYIGPNCKIGNNVKIYPHVYIGDNVNIGDNVILYSGAKIYPNTKIGSYCTIHSGAIIGSAGFGFAPQNNGSYKSIPQVGNVIIEDHVDIGANTVIDCATMGSTIIRKGVKLDNLIQVAHNVEIGKNTVIAAQSGISGSTVIGENCMVGGQVGFAGHLKIANNSKFGAQAGIGKSIKKEGEAFSGSPAINYKDYYKSYAFFKKLPEMMKRVEELEEKILNLPPQKR